MAKTLTSEEFDALAPRVEVLERKVHCAQTSHDWKMMMEMYCQPQKEVLVLSQSCCRCGFSRSCVLSTDTETNRLALAELIVKWMGEA